jgi:hypothetical protein
MTAGLLFGDGRAVIEVKKKTGDLRSDLSTGVRRPAPNTVFIKVALTEPRFPA